MASVRTHPSPREDLTSFARADMVVDEYNLFQRYKLQKACSLSTRASKLLRRSATYDLEGSQTEGRGYVEGVQCAPARPHHPATAGANPVLALASLLQLLLRRPPSLSVRVHNINAPVCAH